MRSATRQAGPLPIARSMLNSVIVRVGAYRVQHPDAKDRSQGTGSSHVLTLARSAMPTPKGHLPAFSSFRQMYIRTHIHTYSTLR